jgi:transcriptional regulator with XRE-family HTH domain
MNWPELIQDLRAAPMTQAQIAAIVDVDQSTISDLSRGLTEHPNSKTADRLRELHKRVLRRAKSKARA